MNALRHEGTFFDGWHTVLVCNAENRWIFFTTSRYVADAYLSEAVTYCLVTIIMAPCDPSSSALNTVTKTCCSCPYFLVHAVHQTSGVPAAAGRSYFLTLESTLSFLLPSLTPYSARAVSSPIVYERAIRMAGGTGQVVPAMAGPTFREVARQLFLC